MKSKLLPFALFCATVAGAQHSPAPPPGYPKEGSPLFVVTGEEINKFPSANFLDAVNGLFPFVFNQKPDANEFLFVVNGFITPDVNGISLADIDRVVYTRNTLHGNAFPFARAGTFYITTKQSREKLAFTFNSQFNTVWNKQMRHSLRTDYGLNENLENVLNKNNNKSGHWTSQHLSASAGNETWNVYASVQWNQLKSPGIRQYTELGAQYRDTSISYRDQKFSQLRAFVQGSYNVASYLTVGITGTYGSAPKRTSSGVGGDFLDLGAYRNDIARDKSTLNYYHLGTYIDWTILPGLSNRMSFEYLDNSETVTAFNRSEGSMSPGIINWSELNSRGNSNFSMTTIRNELAYRLPIKSRFQVNVTAGFGYVVSNKKDDLVTRGNRSAPGGEYWTASWTKRKEKITTVNPRVELSYDSVVQVYGGYALMLNKGISEYSSRSKSNPYAGAIINLKRAMKNPGPLSRLELSFHFADLTRNFSRHYWLPEHNENMASVQGGILTPVLNTSSVMLLPNPELATTLFKNKMVGAGVQAGFNNDRILAGVEWTRLENQRLFLVSMPINPGPLPGAVPIIGNEIISAFTVFVAGTVLEKSQLEWRTRLNVVVPETKWKSELLSAISDGRPLEYKAQIGWQNRLMFGNWSIQLHSLYGIGRSFATHTGSDAKRTVDELVLNYVAASYRLPVKNGLFSQAGLYINGRNLLGARESNNYFQYDRYAGAGVSLSFR